MWLIRDVHPNDLEPLYQLACELNTLNLPANRSVIEALITESQESFLGQHKSGRRTKLVFVLERRWREGGQQRAEVLGSCMIIPQHGTHQRPASYFQIMERQHYSSILQRHFKHQTLELIFDYDGPTELGGLVLSPSLRGHPLKLGRFLSYARLAFIGQPARRSWFQDEVVAELLPALGPQRDSALWPYLGQRFTGLDYHTADKLSREHIHFIQELFPQAPLYTSLLPTEVQEQLGRVGPDSQPAAHLLSKVGFRFDGTIDPFDGGPTFRVRTDECALTRCAVGLTHERLSALTQPLTSQTPQTPQASQREGGSTEVPEGQRAMGALMFDQLETAGGVCLILCEATWGDPTDGALPQGAELTQLRLLDDEQSSWGELTACDGALSAEALVSFTPFEGFEGSAYRSPYER